MASVWMANEFNWELLKPPESTKIHLRFLFSVVACNNRRNAKSYQFLIVRSTALHLNKLQLYGQKQYIIASNCESQYQSQISHSQWLQLGTRSWTLLMHAFICLLSVSLSLSLTLCLARARARRVYHIRCQEEMNSKWTERRDHVFGCGWLLFWRFVVCRCVCVCVSFEKWFERQKYCNKFYLTTDVLILSALLNAWGSIFFVHSFILVRFCSKIAQCECVALHKKIHFMHPNKKCLFCLLLLLLLIWKRHNNSLCSDIFVKYIPDSQQNFDI